MIKRSCVLILLFLLPIGVRSAESTIDVINLEISQWSDAQLSQRADTLALKLKQYVNFSYRTYPPARAIEYFKKGRVACIMVSNKYLVEKYTQQTTLSSLPLAQLKYVYISKQPNNFDSFEQFVNQKVGIFRGAKLTHHIKFPENTKIIEVKVFDDKALIKMVLSDRINLALVQERVVLSLPVDQQRLLSLNPKLPPVLITRHINCLDNEPNSIFIKQINNALTTLKNNGELNQIMGEVVF